MDRALQPSRAIPAVDRLRDLSDEDHVTAAAHHSSDGGS